MAKERILVVEDDQDTANMLHIYFESQGYDVAAATKGGQALQMCSRQIPNVIILDINLPDVDGYDVCRNLRRNLRTSHIPIIFLTQKDQRSDKIAGLETGADDFITKPFDIEELELRVRNALQRSAYENLTSPVSGLPSGKLIEEQLRQLLQRDGWAVLYAGIVNLKGFSEVYGAVAGDDLVRFAGITLSEILDEKGGSDDFIGHVGGGDYLIIVPEGCAEELRRSMMARFNQEAAAFYSFRDRERGHIVRTSASGHEQKIPLASMAVGIVCHSDRHFTDIREITELAPDARRSATGRAHPKDARRARGRPARS